LRKTRNKKLNERRVQSELADVQSLQILEIGQEGKKCIWMNGSDHHQVESLELSAMSANCQQNFIGDLSGS
jgi:hypothetical protein